jgi:exonuclease VII small subunit
VTPELEELVSELENTADQLRAGDLSPEDAAAAVERCAELAARVGATLDAQAREPDETLPGQEELPSG